MFFDKAIGGCIFSLIRQARKYKIFMKEFNFTANIKKASETTGGSYIEFPLSIEECFGHSGRVKVVCYFDDIEYRGSLVKMGTDCHIIGIRKDILTRLGKKNGDTVCVRISEDKEERVVPIHPLLAQAFQKDQALQTIYEALSITKKNEIHRSLESAKKQETQAKRLANILADLEKK